jgi:uncharacterized protein YjdB
MTLTARWTKLGTYVSINPAARISLRLRASYQLATDTDGTEYEYVSSNPLIVKVDQSGLITPARAGMATVSVRLTDGSGLVSSVMVNVTP